ncbi:MAG: phosphoribosylaminoimidazolesuccinocarboxamide synthase [Candidatus Latescibacterota bacterium]|nr:MAG: phosphoribosylaminoimidazolesuccinocarboxamide synthase [Candidatus Latescibacterota bacterium]
MNTKDHGLTPDTTGKVRDVFDLGSQLLIVATDRISAYDVILPNPIPGKGVVLNQMTLGWYDLFEGTVATHFVTADVGAYPAPFKDRQELAGRSMLVKKANRYDVECVVRGYLVGSGWKEYQRSGAVCGIELPGGLVEASKLDEPIFTPATKADTGHDENISFEQMKSIVPGDIAEKLRDLSIEIYNRAHEHARKCGIILADTKFEFGEIGGEIILIDELLSPDSSRFWPADLYEPGRSQQSFDKQFVRDYLDSIEWDHNPPPPELPDDVVQKTFERYREACRQLFPNINLEQYL